MSTRYRWFVVFIFFLFILLHQADRLPIGPLPTPIAAPGLRGRRRACSPPPAGRPRGDGGSRGGRDSHRW